MHSNTNLNKIPNITNANTIDGYDKLHLIDTYINAFTASIEFYSKLNSAFLDAVSTPFADTRNQIKEIKMQVLGDNDLPFTDYDKQQEFYKKAE